MGSDSTGLVEKHVSAVAVVPEVEAPPLVLEAADAFDGAEVVLALVLEAHIAACIGE